MNVHSKPIISDIDKSEHKREPKAKKAAKTAEKNDMDLTYRDFFSKKPDLKKYKIPELKIIAKKNGLHVTGNKDVLIDRIQTYFHNSNIIIKIQANFRRHLVQVFLKLCGPAIKDHTKCVNETDFYTMDPLNEIDIYNFFSYKDGGGFVYGFHIQSLVSMLHKMRQMINPYTREEFDISASTNILIFKRLSQYFIKKAAPPPPPPSIFAGVIEVVENERITNTYVERRFRADTLETLIADNRGNINTRITTIEKLREIREKNMATRINELFMEIDLLGNYTDSSWFSNLPLYSCVRFIQNMFNIWTQRSNMTYQVRLQICPYYNPFHYTIDMTNIFIERNMNIDALKLNALTIMENIVFSGGDIEYRKIGIMHILTALTMVSIQARESLPWLYESVAL